MSRSPATASWWVRSVPGWHAAFGLFVVIAALVLLLGDDEHRLRAALAVGVVALTYVLLGPRAARERTGARGSTSPCWSWVSPSP